MLFPCGLSRRWDNQINGQPPDNPGTGYFEVETQADRNGLFTGNFTVYDLTTGLNKTLLLQVKKMMIMIIDIFRRIQILLRFQPGG